eukprot:scaffold92220_cov36-Prasinocladus_malaysianus.AAC.1
MAALPLSCCCVLARLQVVLKRLGGDRHNGYAYISCMAVRKQDRRVGVASSLLAAAEQLASAYHLA